VRLARGRRRGSPGHPPPYQLDAFDALDDTMRAAIASVRSHPFLPHGTASVVSCTTSIPVACAKWWSSRPYAACNFEMARAMSLDFLIAIARVFVYVALLAWATTFVGLIPVLHSANGRRDFR
jgi:hypothetical protein